MTLCADRQISASLHFFTGDVFLPPRCRGHGGTRHGTLHGPRRPCRGGPGKTEMERWKTGITRGIALIRIFFNKITYIYVYTYTFNTLFYPLGKWTWWIITAILYCLMMILGNMRRNLINYLVVLICSSSEIHTIKQNLPPKGPLIHIFHRLQPPTSFTILLSLLEQIGSTLYNNNVLLTILWCSCFLLLHINLFHFYTDSMHRSCDSGIPMTYPSSGCEARETRYV